MVAKSRWFPVITKVSFDEKLIPGQDWESGDQILSSKESARVAAMKRRRKHLERLELSQDKVG